MCVNRYKNKEKWSGAATAAGGDTATQLLLLLLLLTDCSLIILSDWTIISIYKEMFTATDWRGV
jgi:hypothetical protein